MAYSHKQGLLAEQRAVEFLAEQGLKVIQRNYRKKRGELDIICKDADTWVCIEVKFRRRSQHGHPLETVTPTKLNRMITAFNLFLMDNDLNPAHTSIRFDIVAFNNDELTWLKNVTN